jgi:hyperosmotically inducible protein
LQEKDNNPCASWEQPEQGVDTQIIGHGNRKLGTVKRSWTEKNSGKQRESKKMKTYEKAITAIGAAALLIGIASVVVLGDPPNNPATNNAQLARRVRHELVMLPYYGVFDNLAFSINGNTVTLYGQVLRPTTRSSAERVVKRLPGVARVVNNIHVLPLSSFDDSIRAATYRSIARTGGLYRYFAGANPSLHIVVDRGHVTLEGVVSNKGDRTLAYMAANRVPGVFSVTNNLRVEGEGVLR